MKRKHKERLLKLADYLENKVEAKKFDLDYVVGNTTYGDVVDKKFTKHTCGTAGCAMGYMPEAFPRSFYYDVDEILNRMKIGIYSPTDCTIMKVKKVNGSADIFYDIREFFGLTGAQFENLFMPDAYASGRRGKVSVARRIRDLAYNPAKYLNELYESRMGVS